MAVVRYHTNRPGEEISAERGAQLWKLMTGEQEGTAEEMRICEEIRDLFLNWHNAPDSYIEARKHTIMPMAIGGWMCDARGVPTRPNPGDTFAIEFAKKWGLMVYGRLAPSAAEYLFDV